MNATMRLAFLGALLLTACIRRTEESSKKETVQQVQDMARPAPDLAPTAEEVALEKRIEKATTYVSAVTVRKLKESKKPPVCMYIQFKGVAVYVDPQHSLVDEEGVNTGYYPVLETKNGYVKTLVPNDANGDQERRYQAVYINKDVLGLDWRTSEVFKAETPGTYALSEDVIVKELCQLPNNFECGEGWCFLKTAEAAVGAKANTQE